MDEMTINIRNPYLMLESAINKSTKKGIEGRSNSNYKAIVGRIISGDYKLKGIHSVTKEKNGDVIFTGDITFMVENKDFSITSSFFEDHKREFLSPFMINFIGELLVRENIDIFTKEMLSMPESQKERIKEESMVHKHFGFKITNYKMIFSFHVSLLEKILTEDWKLKL
jgi:hypothetical protein